MIEDELKDILEKTFNCDVLEVDNQSKMHASHASSPGTGQSHFHVKVVSVDFLGVSKINRHRAANQAIAPLFDKGLHAISLTIKSPLE